LHKKYNKVCAIFLKQNGAKLLQFAANCVIIISAAGELPRIKQEAASTRRVEAAESWRGWQAGDGGTNGNLGSKPSPRANRRR
jgi:hypothetical protein